jgi:hypothetical protein
MRKIEKSFICMLLVGMLFVVGCGNVTATVSYTYQLDTGDSIVLSLNTSDGYSLSSNLPFVISKDKEEQSQGTFIEAEYYSIYIDSIENDEDAEIIEQGEKDNCSYVMWNYGGSEYDYVIMINGTDTGILLGNNVSEESARECFDRLTIAVK